MRRPSIFDHRRGELDVKMTPMIDVVFLLLVFFVWTASFHIIEQILPSRVSAASGTQTVEPEVPPPEADFDDVVIRVLWVQSQPVWEVNGQAIGTLDEVSQTLIAVAAIRPTAAVILHPDSQVPLGHVIDLYDLTRQRGFEKVQFAASEAI